MGLLYPSPVAAQSTQTYEKDFPTVDSSFLTGLEIHSALERGDRLTLRLPLGLQPEHMVKYLRTYGFLKAGEDNVLLNPQGIPYAEVAVSGPSAEVWTGEQADVTLWEDNRHTQDLTQRTQFYQLRCCSILTLSLSKAF